MSRYLLVALLLCAAADARARPAEIRRIAFGSCLDQDLPQPIWEPILESRPDLFIFAGDNIYGDRPGGQARDMARLKAQYERLGRDPGFRRLRRTVPILATWDDHDYGQNDGGADYPFRAQSQRIFLDFFGEPAGSRRRRTPGVYTAQSFGPPGRRLQIILLDTRYFRGPLKRGFAFLKPWFGPYRTSEDPQRTVLGAEQWRWLADELRRPAELRLIVSSIQVLPVDHGWEKWGNFAPERRRLFALLRETRARGVVFLSGDRHFAEISRIDKTLADLPYSLYEATSSGLTHAWTDGPREKNRFRLGAAFGGLNFGLANIDWQAGTLRLQIRDVRGATRAEQLIRLQQLNPTHPQT